MRLLLLFLFTLACLFQPSTSRADLASDFKTPPAGARPHTWWHWMNGNITTAGLTADLEAMQRVGIGGVQIFNAASSIPAGSVDYLSPQYLSLFRHAVQEAQRLGLEVGAHNCAGWSSSGGPWVKPEHAMQIVTWTELVVQGGGKIELNLPQPRARNDWYRDIAVLAIPSARIALPAQVLSSGQPVASAPLSDGDLETELRLAKGTAAAPSRLEIDFAAPAAARNLYLRFNGQGQHEGTFEVSRDGKSFGTPQPFKTKPQPGMQPRLNVNLPAGEVKAIRLNFLRPSAEDPTIRIAELWLESSPRLENFEEKAGFVADNSSRLPTLNTDGTGIPRASVIDLTAQVDAHGKLAWQAPAGAWTLLRIGQTHNGKTNHPAPKSGTGLEVDKLSRPALDAFFRDGIEPLLKTCGPAAGKTFDTLVIDSYEVGAQNWTAGFDREFARRRGYSLTTLLPALTGHCIDSPQTTERFLWDFRRTLGDLAAENYFGYFADLCHQRGVKLAVEPYGNGVFDWMRSGGCADLLMGEFWVAQGASESCKWAAATGHVYGRPIIGAESFTATINAGRYSTAPYDFKPTGDLAFLNGINRLIFHRYAHQPWLNKLPGMTMGGWGSHIERTQTWWEQSRAWITYLSRCQTLLQAGRFAADVLYFTGEDVPTPLPNANTLNPRPLPGYDYDMCDATTVLKLKVADGALTLPDGMRYRLLVLPDQPIMSRHMAEQIQRLVAAGAQVVGPPPRLNPSLADGAAGDAELAAIAKRVWGFCDGKQVTEHAYENGRVFCGLSLEQVFARLALSADFAASAPDEAIGALHRRIDGQDFYFVANKRPVATTLHCTFRVSGHAPQLWNPETGTITNAPAYVDRGGSTSLSIRFEPLQSQFVVFTKQAPSASHWIALQTPSDLPALKAQDGNTSADLELLSVIYESVGGSGSVDATAAVAKLIRNGQLSFRATNELAGDPAPNSAKQLRVAYRYLGKESHVLVREGLLFTFPGASSVPISPQPYPACLSIAGSQSPQIMAFAPGTYTATTADGRHLAARLEALPEPMIIDSPWGLFFPAGWRAPERVTLPKLISWTQLPEGEARYFSGTATYHNIIRLPDDWLAPGKSVWLDLGVVKNLAEVEINGQELGTLWKSPFRVNITPALRSGANRLEIRVTNLWVNRLIGDEQFPADCEWEPDRDNSRHLKAWPTWLLQDTPRLSEQRLTFSTWGFYEKDDPLLPSGLLGPVTLRCAQALELK
jgi:hypothetical protein